MGLIRTVHYHQPMQMHYTIWRIFVWFNIISFSPAQLRVADTPSFSPLLPLPFPPLAFRAMATAAPVLDGLHSQNRVILLENVYVPLPSHMEDSTGTLTGTIASLGRLDSFYFCPKHLPHSASHESWEGYLHFIAWHREDKSPLVHCLDKKWPAEMEELPWAVRSSGKCFMSAPFCPTTSLRTMTVT